MIKYSPTVNEVKEMFKEWYRICLIKPSEINEILKINLKKWNMMKYYIEILNYVISI